MQVDKYGNYVGYEERLRDIKNRYGVDSKVYNTCLELVKQLQEKNKSFIKAK